MSSSRYRRFALILLLVLAACAPPGTPAAPTPTLAPGTLVQSTPDPAQIPALAERLAAIRASLDRNPPVLLLDGLDAPAQRAQQLALNDLRVLAQLRTPAGDPLRNEVFTVRRVTPADVTPPTQVCEQQECYRVEIYHYATNSTTIVVVSLTLETVLDAQTYQNMQPADVPEHLADLAIQIAQQAPEVQQALTANPDVPPPVMENVKTALNGTRCERAQHLCVAPTFHAGGQQGLWAIVDLTDLRLVGIQWTNLGPSGPPIITEKTIEDSAIASQYCDQENTLERDGWRMQFILTGSDGLRISDVSFEGRPVLRSAKLVDWHVSYSGEQQFGYSDAIGCPVFSAAAVPAYSAPTVEALATADQVHGFALVQDYQHPAWPHPCQYYYRQRYEFYADGSFRVVAMNLGRGCGDDGTYRPVLRIDLAGADQTFAAWSGSAWEEWQTEQWALTTEQPVTDEGFAFRIAGSSGAGYYIEPGRGQWDDERGDHAYVYVTTYKPEEGDADLLTIGPCCNTNHEQGPEQFQAPPEPISATDLVLWYVPQMENDGAPGEEYCWANTVVDATGVFEPVAWPCASGPRFVPIAGGAE